MARVRLNGFDQDIKLPLKGPKFIYVDAKGKVHLTKEEKREANREEAQKGT